MKENYSLKTEAVISEIKNSKEKPSLLLHVCCAPCSSYVIEYLSRYFEITLYYYNPNISPKSEYDFRLSELNRFVEQFPDAQGVKFLFCEYDPQRFFNMVKGLEAQPEGGERCKKCYRLRLENTAKAAATGGFDFFTTTLTISPYKNAEWLNLIGKELSEEYSVSYLFSDFKKKNGYKRSVELSDQYGLYRQNFCGCPYSKAQSEAARLEKNKK